MSVWPHVATYLYLLQRAIQIFRLRFMWPLCPHWLEVATPPLVQYLLSSLACLRRVAHVLRTRSCEKTLAWAAGRNLSCGTEAWSAAVDSRGLKDNLAGLSSSLRGS